MKPLTVTTDNFDKEVLNSTKPSVLDFWATWCGPCRAIAPIIEELAKEYDGKVVVGKVDVDNNQDIAIKYGVRAIPTLVFFKGGKEVDRIVGNTQKSGIVAKLNALL